MQISIERAALLGSLSHIQSLVERRTTLPILANVLIHAQGDSITLSATDMEISLSEKVPAVVEEAGGFTVPAHVLYDIVRKLADGSQISLQGAGDGEPAKLAAGKSRFSLPTLPGK